MPGLFGKNAAYPLPPPRSKACPESSSEPLNPKGQSDKKRSGVWSEGGLPLSQSPGQLVSRGRIHSIATMRSQLAIALLVLVGLAAGTVHFSEKFDGESLSVGLAGRQDSLGGPWLLLWLQIRLRGVSFFLKRPPCMPQRPGPTAGPSLNGRPRTAAPVTSP